MQAELWCEPIGTAGGYDFYVLKELQKRGEKFKFNLI